MSPAKSTKKYSAEKAKELILKSAGTNDLLSFSQILDYKYQVNWHHQIIARALEKARKQIENGIKARIILEVPPRHGKSELATIKFPAQTLGLHPDWPIIVSSYSAELAEDFGLKTRDILNDERYRAIFTSSLRQDTPVGIIANGQLLTNGDGYSLSGNTATFDNAPGTVYSIYNTGGSGTLGIEGTATGAYDGSNKTFTTTHIPVFMAVEGEGFVNGDGYSLSSLTETMDNAPVSAVTTHSFFNQ